MTVSSNELQNVSSQQVFTSVPTNEDMQTLNDRLQNERRGRGRLLIAVIFLCGVIAAGLLGLLLLYGGMAERVSALETVIAQKDEIIEASNSEVDALNGVIADQASNIASFADFQTIKLLQDQADQIQATIAALLSEPSRANAPQRLKQLPEQIEWRDDVVNALRERLDALEQKQEAVAAWPPPVANPRPD